MDLREEWDGFISFCWFLDYRAILNDGKLLWYCDALCDGDENDFADVSPYSITNALGGLSVSTRGSGNIYLPPHYMSYISTDQKVHISTHSGYDYLTMPFTGTHLVTALGVCEEFVICCYEHAYPSGQGIKCWLKCSEGSPWSGSAIAEPRPGEGDFMMPDVACFYDGCAATYQQDLSGVDGVFVRVRLGLGSGPPSQWLDPVQFNDYDIDTVYASPPTITHVGATSEECCYSYGTAYISGNQLFYPPQTRPYFDRAPGPGDYCQACGTWHPVYIANVDVGSISRPSGNTRYAEYTEYSTQMGIGLSHELTVTLGNGSQSCQGGVWIDWNQDQDFDDAGEAISVNGSPGAGPYTATISPPVSAVLGETRMRIRVTSDQTPQPCSGQDEGEVEDYTVEVVNYCEASSGCGQYISRVEFAGMDNSSVCDGYAYYPGLVGDIQRGLTYPATITIANGYSGNFGGLWFDWNHDPGEEISLSPSFGPGPYTAIVTVPLYANLGLTRMRVRLHRETDWTWPCDDEPFGEVEDYVVNITESPYCLALSECDHYISRV
ncbi:MAG: GEVED domain-containing protein, partial [Planctomycetota bacterium]